MVYSEKTRIIFSVAPDMLFERHVFLLDLLKDNVLVWFRFEIMSILTVFCPQL